MVGVPLGTTPKNAADARERGAQWGVCGIDTALLADGMRACLANFTMQEE